MTFHYLVRGVIIFERQILLARQIGAKNTFLPGGHINPGESAEMALKREIREEIGREANIKGFTGAIEHIWPEDRRDNHEINLLFEVAMADLKPPEPPRSFEHHLEFIWSDLAHLKAHNLQPYPLIPCIEDWNGSYNTCWGTSL